MDRSGAGIHPRPRRSFDVICAGEPVWRAARAAWDLRAPPEATARAGLLDAARTLALARVHVGLATVLEDDRLGRKTRAELTALGVDIGGVKLAPMAAELVVVDAAGGQSRVISERGGAPDLEIPPSWSSQVLLLSGLSAVTSRLAALCRAARRARRDGTLVVLDATGSLHHWAGRDPRVISMVLREADIVRCSLLDLAVIGTDSAAVRRAMRASATLVVTDGAGTTATGVFGQVRVPAPREPSAAERFAEGCTAAVCAEYARPQGVGETPAGRWDRILRQGFDLS
jgi:sugar/nucleoside kinase (ribokinase family)